ncbi:hypothetical protein BDN72DRAFT_524722 [Pluteus cervinus]|uniref:Uncharacterized protein n=1 Tax=Pluteus cervinus TaxID=181527 RepID=A0ACD3A4C5_9AGAR|nr:hypothetical protein BDN72DRAFT_524722 [Pluteus cervinus]
MPWPGLQSPGFGLRIRQRGAYDRSGIGIWARMLRIKGASDRHTYIDQSASTLDMEPQKVIRAVISAFHDGQITVDEIKDMANTARDIRNRFRQVSVYLEAFDDGHYKREDGSPVGQLRPTWEGYYEEYKTLLRNSTSSAMDLKCICDDYLEIIVPAYKDKSIGSAEFKDIVEIYKAKTIAHERTSDFYAQAFEDLSRKLTNFKHLEKVLRACDDKIDTTAGALGAFWSAVNGDVRLLVEKLDTAIAANTADGTLVSRPHISEG